MVTAPHPPRQTGKTSLWYAARYRNDEALRLLLMYNADPNKADQVTRHLTSMRPASGHGPRHVPGHVPRHLTSMRPGHVP
jgi:hypothetical protein